MSEIQLMISPSYVIELSGFNGNIDADILNPLIAIAQTTHVKSFLGLSLYNKIYNDFINATLAGSYETIYLDYIKDLIAYQACVLYVEFGSYKVGENGIHKVTSENRETIDESETTKLALRYNKLVANVEGNFKEYVEPLNLTELSSTNLKTNTDFPWH